MKSRAFALLSIALLAALALVACGGEPTPAPTETPVPEDAGSTGSGPSSLDLTDMSTFEEIPTDYSMTMVFNFRTTAENGDPIDSTLMIDGVFQQDPLGSNVEMMVTGAGDLGGVDSVSYAEVGETLYFYNAVLGCVILPGQQETLYNNFVDTGGLLTGVVQRIQPDEEVNGVPSYAFAITEDNLDPTDPAGAEVQELTGGTLYVAKDGGYVTRLVLEGRGVSEVLTQSDTLLGDINYQLDFIPEPGGVTINIPENCEEASGEASSDYPVMDDATNIASFDGLVNYQTSYDIDTVANFYKTELAAAGWTLVNEIAAGGTAALQFEMGGRQLSVAIAPAAGVTSVVIAEQ